MATLKDLKEHFKKFKTDGLGTVLTSRGILSKNAR